MAFGSKDGLRAELKREPVLWAFLGCWIFEAGMNAIFGYRQAGGGFSLAALLYGAVFLFIAYIGAWTAVRWFAVQGQDGTAWSQRAAFAIPCIACLMLSQFSGWGVLGVTLADGSAKRTIAATSSATSATALKLKQDERAALVVKRSIEAIDAEIDLELRKTSRQFPNGDGPKAMKLKAEKADATRAHALDQEIKDAMAELEGKPAVAEGNPEFDVVTGWTDATPETVRKYFSVFIVALVGFFATFGPALAGVGQDAPPVKSKADAFLDQLDFGPRRVGSDLPAAPYMPDQQVAALREKLEAARGIDRGTPQSEGQPMPREPLSGGHPPPFPRSLDRASDAHPYGASAREGHGYDGRATHATVQGAPIAIHNHFAGGAPGPAPHDYHGNAPSQPVALRAAPPQLERSPAPPLLTGPPVDRSGLLAQIDQVLLFKQACLLDTPGGVVSGEAMYAAYAEWAGVRALSQDGFLGLFIDFAEVPVQHFANRPHFINVALREAQPREVLAS